LTAVERALLYIENLRATRRQRPATAKAAPKTRRSPVRRAKRAPRPAQDAYWPEPNPVDLVKLAAQQAVFTPPPTPPVEWSITAERTAAVNPMTDAEALAFGIRPDGETVDDWLDAPLPGWQAPWKGTG